VHRCESKKSALNPQGQRALALVPGRKCCREVRFMQSKFLL